MGKKLSRRDRFYTGVIIFCLVGFLIFGCYVLSVYLGTASWIMRELNEGRLLYASTAPAASPALH